MATAITEEDGAAAARRGLRFWYAQRIVSCCLLTVYAPALLLLVDPAGAAREVLRPLVWGLIMAQIFRHSALGMTLGYHRYFTHAAYKAPRWYEAFIAYCCAACNQGAPSWWAGTHRYHHVHCDTERDPHSPVSHHFLYAWLGWAYDPRHALRRIKLRYPEVRALDDWGFVVPWLEWGVVFAVSGNFAFATLVTLLPAGLSPIGTLWFNCLSHGGPPDENGCTARIYRQVTAWVLGEMDHKDHHIHPNKAHRPGIDLPYWLVLRPLRALGVLSDFQD